MTDKDGNAIVSNTKNVFLDENNHKKRKYDDVSIPIEIPGDWSDEKMMNSSAEFLDKYKKEYIPDELLEQMKALAKTFIQKSTTGHYKPLLSIAAMSKEYKVLDESIFKIDKIFLGPQSLLMAFLLKVAFAIIVTCFIS